MIFYYLVDVVWQLPKPFLHPLPNDAQGSTTCASATAQQGNYCKLCMTLEYVQGNLPFVIIEHFQFDDFVAMAEGK